MRKLKIVGIAAVILTIPVLLTFYNLGMISFFKPKFQNVERKVFENTKSYLHGVQQDLGKYYLEYQDANEDEKQAIKTTIQMRFAEVNAEKLQSPQLRSFLISARGY